MRHSAEIQPQRDPGSFATSLESNSGSTFVHTFATAVSDPSNVPQVPMFPAWNLFLGARQMAPPVLSQSITDILSFTDMENLATMYLTKLDPCYGFIDRAALDQGIRQRWLPNSQYTRYDAVLCGVAALGCLFSTLKDLETEARLFSLAKYFLDLTVSQEPSVDSAIAWVLRTVYLRLTAKPDEAWMASCTALHVIDAVGLHCEPDATPHFSRAARECTPDTRRRIFGVARHLNIWLSFDLARSRVILQNVSSIPPSTRPNDYTTELLELLPYTENLDPAKTLKGAELLAAFSEVVKRTHTQSPSVLAQCNLMLCLYRRLYTLKWTISTSALEKAVQLIQQGIRAVYMTVENGSPWHHVANVPFQSICTLLAIDTAQSFSLLSDAVSCLDAVNQAYQTEATKDAVTAARALIYMHQKRREADVKRQSEMLNLYPPTQTTNEESWDNLVLSQAFTDLPWWNDLIPDLDFGDLSNGQTFGL